MQYQGGELIMSIPRHAPLHPAGSSTSCAALTARFTRASPTTCPSGWKPTRPARSPDTPAAGSPWPWPTASPWSPNRRLWNERQPSRGCAGPRKTGWWW